MPGTGRPQGALRHLLPPGTQDILHRGRQRTPWRNETRRNLDAATAHSKSRLRGHCLQPWQRPALHSGRRRGFAPGGRPRKLRDSPRVSHSPNLQRKRGHEGGRRRSRPSRSCPTPTARTEEPSTSPTKENQRRHPRTFPPFSRWSPPLNAATGNGPARIKRHFHIGAIDMSGRHCDAGPINALAKKTPQVNAAFRRLLGCRLSCGDGS